MSDSGGAGRVVLTGPVCPLCESPGAQFYARHSRVDQDLYRCGACAFCFVHPHESRIPTVTDGEADHEFSFWGSEAAHEAYQEWRDAENREIGALALDAFGEHCERLLEIGFGEGPLTEILLPSVHEYWGIEPVPATHRKAVERLALTPQRALCMRAEELGGQAPFDEMDGYFDLVVMVSVFEHLSQPRQVLLDCFRLLRPGGRLLISTPDSTFFPQFRFLRRLVRMEPWTHFHISFFNEDNLERVFRAVGFAVVDRRERALVTPLSTRYFRELTGSRLVGWLMTLFRTSGLAAKLRTHTLFYVLDKPER